MNRMPVETDNVIAPFQISLQARLNALEAKGMLTDTAVDDALLEFVKPLKLQAQRVLALLESANEGAAPS